MRQVEDDMRRKSGNQINGHDIYELRYADDTALLLIQAEGDGASENKQRLAMA